MSKHMSADELGQHIRAAIQDLHQTLDDFQKSTVERVKKRAMLIGYWIKTYARYLRDEDSFSPQSVYKLKRGSIVVVEFGYRVGRELGGRHYAAVLDVNNPVHGNTVTVIPLGSKKTEFQPNQFSIALEDGIYPQVNAKLKALMDDTANMIRDADSMSEQIEAATIEEAAVLRAVQRTKNVTAKEQIQRATDWRAEISHMKAGTIANVCQITTVSKMRISQPLKKTHPLYGVRLSARDMDAIDKCLKKLFFQEPSRVHDS